MTLTTQQIQHFHDEGYLVIDSLFDDADLQPVIDDISAEIDRLATELVASGELSQTFDNEGFMTRLSRITAETDVVLKSVIAGKLATPGIFGLLTNPKLLDAMESLVGSEIIASSAYRIRPKVPGYGRGVVPWHQDSAFFEPYCDTSLICTVWIPLVDATADRGCLQVIPRQHQGNVVTHHLPEDSRSGLLEIVPQELPEGDVVTVPVKKGGALLLTNRTPHRSIENITDVIRWSMDLRYQSAKLPTNYKLPSGENFSHPDDADAPLACYPPEADFLVRSKNQPEAVVSDWQQFRNLRVSHQGTFATDRWGLGT
jgi:phytanoyl-CoA hydroxylase